MKPLRILIVEDEPAIAGLLTEVLEEMGHAICAIVATQADAVAAAARDRPDLMVVDAQLREGNGVAAVADILRAGFIPHVFATGGALGHRQFGPGTVVIQKPFREADLVCAIDRALIAVPTN